MKKEKSNVLVVFTILILVLFIALPPIFRMTYPKENLTIGNKIQEQNKLVLLTCRGVSLSDGYEITSYTRYINGVVKNNTITFTTSGAADISSVTPSALEQLNAFKTVEGLVIENETSTTVTIDSNILSANPILVNYLQEKAQQKAYYESMGYTCTEIEA